MRQRQREHRARAGPAFAISALGVVLVAVCMRQAVAGIPPVLGDLGLDPGQQSLLVTIPDLCFCLGALAGPAVRARLGEERAILVLIATLLGGLGIRASWPAAGSIPGTILAGLSIALLNVLLSSLVKRRFAQQVGLMTATYTSAMTVGAALAAGLTVPILRRPAQPAWRSASGRSRPCWPWLSGCHRSGSGRRRPTAATRAAHGDLALPAGVVRDAVHGDAIALVLRARCRGCPRSTATVASMRPTPASCYLLFNVCGIVGNLAAPVLASRMADQRRAVGATLTLYLVGLLGVLLAPPTRRCSGPLLLGWPRGRR